LFPRKSERKTATHFCWNCSIAYGFVGAVIVAAVVVDQAQQRLQAHISLQREAALAR
jgi:hypothetical protein